VQSWIDNLREKYSFTHFQQEIRKIEELRVLVIGEIIVDEYTHVEALGKVNKDPILAFDKLGNSTFLGGAFAVAKNIACWSKHVTLVSYVGSNWSNYESLMLDSSKIELKLIHENNRPTIRKHRYISNSDNRKLFEYYDFSEEIISEESRNQIEDFLEENLFKYDLVLVCDYGHGLIDEKLANYLSNLSTFLAVNVQQNAGNRGFNSIEKYSNVDFFTLNINEMQWTIKSKSFQREFAIEELMHKLKSSAAILTLGPEGLLAFKTDQSLLSAWVPAFSTKIVDKVGAGDAIYAMSALLICTSSPLEIAGLASSLIAADEISKFGHTNPLTIKSLLKQVKSILA
jgi:rfaE bifunctional protein kinase chain/domain